LSAEALGPKKRLTFALFPASTGASVPQLRYVNLDSWLRSNPCWTRLSSERSHWGVAHAALVVAPVVHG